MKTKTSNISRATAFLAVALFAMAGITPVAGVGAVKCDTAKGFGDENVSCPLTCEPNDTVSGTIQQFNGDATRKLYVEVDCGSAFRANLCKDTDMCSAKDDNDANEFDIGHCKGWADEEWNDYYTIELWCSSAGGDSTATLFEIIEGGVDPMETCAAIVKAVGERGLPATSVAYAKAVFVGGVWLTEGFGFVKGLCSPTTPQATASEGGLLLEA